MHDLLNDPIIRIEYQQQRSSVCLPELLARLQQGAVDAYPGLRAHQADPWHVFLVQLAAAVLSRTESATHDPVPEDAAWWRNQLLALAEGKASAWHLVEPDVTQPAFMQHPWRKGMEEAGDYGIQISKRGQQTLNAKAETPDDLDVLNTAKNHDLKSGLSRQDDIEAWMFALVTYQTTSGYFGNRNQGIVRMNGGYGSRSCISWVSDPNPGRRFCEELPIVISLRESTLTSKYGYSAHGVLLTWLNAWDRSAHQYMLCELDPLFIESCRAVRLWPNSSKGWCALGDTRDGRQIGPKNIDTGDVGDPWTAITLNVKKDGHPGPVDTALTPSGEGFSPKLLTKLIFQDGHQLTKLQMPRKSSNAGWLVGSVVVRGKGGTSGFHRIEIPVPAKAAMSIFAPKDTSARQRAAESAKRLLADAGNAANALADALYAYYDAGEVKPAKHKTKGKIGSDKKGAEAKWLAAIKAEFNLAWPQAYFPTLWRVCDESDEQAALREWRRNLATLAQTHLKMAAAKLPLCSSRKWLACTHAESKLIGLLHHHHLLEPTTQASKENP